MEIVSLSKITKTYHSDTSIVTALDSVNLQLSSGESVAITGRSGAGKTTLLQILGGLSRPTQGEVIIAGKNIGSLSDAELSHFRRKTIGFLFQFFHLQAYLTAQENVATPLLLDGVAYRTAMKRAHELLDAVGLATRASHHPSTLSGGELQRVALARAIANRPKLILADEPTANLDKESAQRVLTLLTRSLAPASALVVITHDPQLSKQFDRQITLHEGRLV